MPGLELDMTVAKYRLKKQFEELKRLTGEYSGATLGQDANGKIKFDVSNVYGLENEDIALLNQAAETFNKFQGEYDAAAEKYNKQKDAYDEAVTAQRRRPQQAKRLQDFKKHLRRLMNTTGKSEAKPLHR